MIYFLRCSVTRLVKIGYTSQAQIASRIAQLKVGCPTKLELLGAQDGDTCHEAALHAYYREKRSHGEWFALTDEDIANEKLRPAAAVEQEWAATRDRMERDPKSAVVPYNEHHARKLRMVDDALVRARAKKVGPV